MSHVIMYVREKPVLKEADRQDNHFADTHTRAATVLSSLGRRVLRMG